MPFTIPSSRTGRSRSPRAAAWSNMSRSWAKVRGDKLAYRFLDFSTERDGVARELPGRSLQVPATRRDRRLAAAGHRARRPRRDPVPAEPRVPDCVLRHAVCRPHRGAAVRPVRARPRRPVARRARRLPSVGHPDHHRRRRGVRKFFRSRPANERPRVIAVDAVPDEVAAHLGAPGEVDETTSPTCSTPGVHPHPDRCGITTSTWPPTSCRSSRP